MAVTLRNGDTAAHVQITTLAMNILLSMTPDANQEVPLDCWLRAPITFSSRLYARPPAVMPARCAEM